MHPSKNAAARAGEQRADRENKHLKSYQIHIPPQGRTGKPTRPAMTISVVFKAIKNGMEVAYDGYSV